MNAILRYLLARVAERSTAAGLAAAILGFAGYAQPERIDATTTVIVIIAGMALTLLPTGGNSNR